MSMPDDSDPYGRRQARGRRLLIGGVVAAVVVAALLALWIARLTGTLGSVATDRADPAATATEFLQRYAVHDPAACELVTADLGDRLGRDGRCSGSTTGAAPRIEVLDSITCGTRHAFSAQVDPPGEVTKPYARVGLEQVGEDWSVRSVLPLEDRSVITPSQCAAPETEYGG